MRRQKKKSTCYEEMVTYPVRLEADQTFCCLGGELLVLRRIDMPPHENVHRVTEVFGEYVRVIPRHDGDNVQDDEEEFGGVGILQHLLQTRHDHRHCVVEDLYRGIEDLLQLQQGPETRHDHRHCVVEDSGQHYSSSNIGLVRPPCLCPLKTQQIQINRYFKFNHN